MSVISIENILSLTSKIHGLPTEELIGTVTEELLCGIAENTDRAFSETTYEKLHLLSALFEHKTKNEVEQPKKNLIQKSVDGASNTRLQNLWLEVAENYFSRSGCDSNSAIQFLMACIPHFTDLETKHCFTVIQKHVVLSVEGLGEGKPKPATQLLIRSLTLVEAFLNPCTSTTITELQKSFFLLLCNIILEASEALVESSYHLRMAGLLSSSLSRMKHEKFSDSLWERIFSTLIAKGEVILKAHEDIESVVQYCLVLIDLLLDFAYMETAAGDQDGLQRTKTLLCHCVLWIVIQNGLKSKKPAVRKQALFGLRKALLIVDSHSDGSVVSMSYSAIDADGSHPGTTSAALFLWDTKHKDSLDSFWRDFLLIAETLEENQLHVVTPVLKKFHGLVAMTNANEILIHTSWICMLLQRMISHESKAITREGIIMSLQLDANVFPFLCQEFGHDFLCNSSGEGLIPALQDVNLFCDFRDNTIPQSDTAELPVVAVHLQEFLMKCFTGHPNPTSFLSFIIDTAVKINWGSVPLYYFSKGLSLLLKCDAWSSVNLKSFQSVIAKCSRTHVIKLRHAIQDVLLRCMMKFTNCSQVIIEEVLNVVVLCNGKEFFKNSAQLWNEISLWMFENFKFFQNGSDKGRGDSCLFALKRLEQFCVLSSLQQHDVSFEELRKESSALALLVLMVEEATHSHEDSPGENFLKAVFVWLGGLIEKASTHLYMPKEKVYKAITILNHLVTMWSQLSNNSITNCKPFYNDLFKILRSLLSYVNMRFSSGCVSMEDVKFCLDTWRKLCYYLTILNPKCQWPLHLALEFAPIMSAAQNTYSKIGKVDQAKDENALKGMLTSVFCLSWMCHLVEDFSIAMNQNLSSSIGEFLANLDISGEVFTGNSGGDAKLGKKMEQYNAMMWSCVPFALKLQGRHKSQALLLDSKLGLESFLDQLDTVTEHNFRTYLEALGALIPEVLKASDEHEFLICRCLDASWKFVDSLAHSPAFWKSYRLFISAAYQKATLSLADSSQVQDKLRELLSNIALLSAAKPGLIKYACKACINSWTECSCEEGGHDETVICDKCVVNTGFLKVHLDFVVQCLTFSVIHKKEDLALQNVLKLVEMEKENDSDFTPDQGTEHFVTLTTIAMLLQLDSKSTNDREIGSTIIHSLLELDAAMTKKKSRYHHNSIHHHVKNKIFQSVLLLLPHLSPEEGETSIKFLMSSLKNDAQPSVRYLMEWTLALLIHRFQSYEDMLLMQLKYCESDDISSDSAPGRAKFSAICSYLTVALFIGHCKSTNLQEEFFLDLINICLPWCLSQHFSIRLYALGVILRIKTFFEKLGKVDFLVEKYPALPTCLLFADKATGNVGKNWIKMKDNFFIFDFNPLEDLSLETVYISIPRLCVSQEIATLQDLSSVVNVPRKGEGFVFKTRISLFNTRGNLRSKKSTKWIPQESKQDVDSFVSQDMRYRKNYGAEDITTEPSNLCNGGDNVQKKIMPWLDMVDAASKESQAKNRPKGLILVASLIDKPSNLGGLTRTCEIFGAEMLVVQSLNCTSDKLYQSLSVTAHKWLPMKEVKPWQLEEYLHEMRKEGYTLVGTEQTAQSVCLSAFRFPEKCVVVLGNEKEGIPISILKLLDVCIQIPQKGIIRSLNVHVSGAIAVWEYARQRLLAE